MPGCVINSVTLDLSVYDIAVVVERLRSAGLSEIAQQIERQTSDSARGPVCGASLSTTDGWQICTRPLGHEGYHRRPATEDVAS